MRMTMHSPFYPTTLTLVVIIILVVHPLPNLILAATSCRSPCRDSCGSLPIRYPFGIGPGCGYPPFRSWVFCDDNQLTLLTRSDRYRVTSIDYSKQIVFISVPNMSTCSKIIPKSDDALIGILDASGNTPYSIHDDTHLALLGCSNISLVNNSIACEQFRDAKSICKGLAHCTRADDSGMDSNSTCCVYSRQQSDMPNFWKAGCSSYFAVYGHGKQLDDDPSRWRFGVGLRYKFPPINGTGYACTDCMKITGECGLTIGECQESYCPGEDCGHGSWGDWFKDYAPPSPDDCNDAFKILGQHSIGLYVFAWFIVSYMIHV